MAIRAENEAGLNVHPTSGNGPVILAGSTGALGLLIAHYLVERGAEVRALVRNTGRKSEEDKLKKAGVTIVPVDFNSLPELTQACAGGSCVVSALSGLEDVIVGVQARLLKAAVDAGVPRFIPSDYCIDYTKLEPGSNRNLDLRRQFRELIDKAPIKATSIFNGMFSDLLTGEAPIILFGLKRVIHWGDADQKMDFTTMDNTAAFTAAAALDRDTPRFLHIAGEVANSHDLQKAASEATGKKFRLMRLGGLKAFGRMIRITRALIPKNDDVFPPWQGMQYMHNMYSGLPKLNPLHNDRYTNIRWTSLQDVLAKRTT